MVRTPGKFRPNAAERISCAENKRHVHESAPAAPTLDSIVSGLVLPQLRAHFLPDVLDSNSTKPLLSSDDVDAFCALCMEDDFSSALAYCDACLDRGLQLSDLFISLLAPSARMLGSLWETDRASFVDVSIGLTVISQLYHRLSPPVGDAYLLQPNRPKILLAPAPGERHSFGLLAVGDAFRKAGWSVSGSPDMRFDDILTAVDQTKFDLIGFSLSVDRHRSSLEDGIVRVRDASRNAASKVVVGGQAFRKNSQDRGICGADAFLSSPKAAVDYADRLLALKRQRSQAIAAE